MDFEPKTYIDQPGEWRNRKITFGGVVRGLISQLRIGQDITRVALPSIFLAPYSLLEVAAYRMLSHIDILYEASEKQDRFSRLIGVVRWFLSFVEQEKFEKKPYNPIQGETLYSFVECPRFGRTNFLAEQVSHHPPISAYVTQNEQINVQTRTSMSFEVKFSGNSVAVKTQGSTIVKFLNHNEDYEIITGLPELAIKNVVFGSRRIVWNGQVRIRCIQTGQHALLNFSESGSLSYVESQIFNSSVIQSPTLYAWGSCGQQINIASSKNGRDAKCLVNGLELQKLRLRFSPTLEQSSSLLVWASVSNAIVDDCIERADFEKKRIEDAQRRRLNEARIQNKQLQPIHFQFNNELNRFEPMIDTLELMKTNEYHKIFSKGVIDPLAHSLTISPGPSPSPSPNASFTA
eukprot:TRINITY_DN791_c2_g1_i1.p1 TRINITY_DN791_c2_g1~~TRINITY_DN791_c2_g1_i1.p1  ORF type:complete len:404 (-),score=195.43 TRINITY_DN791_c2_g1_i1:88-1299(-)